MLTSSNRLTRPIVLAVVVAAALAGASCGDDEPSADSKASTERPAKTTDTTAETSTIPESPPAESPHPVTSDIKKMRRAFLADDIAGICALMTDSAKLSAGLAAHGKQTTCERDVRRLFKAIAKGGGWEYEGQPRVTGMTVKQGKATALMSLGQELVEAPLVKEDGEWKLDGFFGTPRAAAVSFAKHSRQRPFPAAKAPVSFGDTRVKVRDAQGSPCPELSDKQYPTIEGGCEVHAASPAPLQLSVLTPLGQFPFEKCSISYRVLANRHGATWTDTFDAVGDPNGACGDVNACFDDKSETLLPWKGRLRSDGRGGFYHRMHACINTCVGSFVGDLLMHLHPEGPGWRVEADNGGGSTGFRFEGPLTIAAKGVEIEPFEPIPDF